MSKLFNCISIAVSCWRTLIHHGVETVYFDSSATLLLLLLARHQWKANAAAAVAANVTMSVLAESMAYAV